MLKQRFIFAIILNAVIVAAEIVFGIAANSMSLLSDAVHNLGDVVSIIIALVAILFSQKKVSRKMTYGFIRSEMMAGFINSLFLLFSMVFIAYESVLRIFKPGNVNGLIMIVVAAIALIANVASSYLIRDSRTHRHSREDSLVSGGRRHPAEDQDMNVKAVTIHLVSDAGISLGVILGGVLIHYLKIPLIDPVFSILFSLFILIECFRVLRTTFLSLMDASSKNLDAIESKILSHKEIISIHDIHLSKPSSQDVYFSAHIVLKESTPLKNIEELLESLRGELRELGVTHPLFQPETGKYHNQEKMCQPHCE